MFSQGDINWKLQGKSYIWMFPIYGLAGLLFPPILKYIGHLHFAIRAIIFAIGILLVEFISGALLDFFTGQCPWEYTTGWHVMGYIRLDYFPFWVIFAAFIDWIISILNKVDLEK